MKIEIRSDHVLLDGYVNAVGRDSKTIADRRGGFVEQVMPGTFARALGRGNTVELKLNHERVLGSTSDGVLELVEDAIGLRAKAKITDPEVIKKARNQQLLGWSFGFRDPKDEWEERVDTIPRRYLKDITLTEVTIVDDTRRPAYIATSIEVRDFSEQDTEYVFHDEEREDAQVQEDNHVDPQGGTESKAAIITQIAGYKARRNNILYRRG
ncbi:MAG: HK97 family phage prohead protease [Oscillospiraceae bacterium]|nr:HK97 family phage prohead protease [Oscillospiraceae bacterium]